MLQRLPPPGQVCSGGRSPILIRSELPLPKDSDSPPIPGSLPNPPIEGGSAGRATGRPMPPNELEGFGGAGTGAGAVALGAAFFAAGRAALRAFVLVLRFVLLRPFAAVRLGRADPDRFAVVFLAVVRFGVDFFPPARFAGDRLAVAFFEDFFFAGISPPFGMRDIARA
jgi:hypothetical protein